MSMEPLLSLHKKVTSHNLWCIACSAMMSSSMPLCCIFFLQISIFCGDFVTRLVAMESRCVSSVSLHSQRTLLLTSSCGNFSIEYASSLYSPRKVVIVFRCSALNSFQIPAFIAILHSAMTKSAPRTLHHQAHANHQRHLQSVSVSEQITSAALDNIRVIIDRECGFPVYYTGCSAAQCVCVSAFNISVVSLLPTIPLSTSATSINISAIASLRYTFSRIIFPFISISTHIYVSELMKAGFQSNLMIPHAFLFRSPLHLLCFC